ncbi:MAG: beta-lactamase family protein [Candidatus Marinimicrobia bacterium]|nr:beta-lactamase family protein [Candidatus Neomarinimicrobiota bacterium]MBL7010398.1 beta-lactamase family protein [Candidatus Neomarinimicrobiota bacterium]MBL7030841.1 beta-lactamase family protein [Candidatus Neomarinimicrobiota bacterium]
MKNRFIYIFIINAFLLLFLLFSCADTKQEEKEAILNWTNLDLTEDWQTGKTNADGIDPEKLEAAIEKVKALSDFYSIGIVFRGRLVKEVYNVGDSDRKYHVWSVTKSITSALVGQLIDSGELKDEFVTIGELYPGLNDSLKQTINIYQLLTMTSGIKSDDDFADYMSYPNPTDFILARDLDFNPGTWWGYTSAGTHLLSDVFRKISKQPIGKYADEHLFLKIGITDINWISDQQGNHNGGYGINIKLKDMLKFGQLYLQQGKSAGEEIISSGWIKKSTTMVIPFNSDQSWGYGYLWWIRKMNGELIYNALGYGGQYIMVIPNRALVVAVTSSSTAAADYLEDIYDSITNGILSSFSTLND